MNDNLKSRTMKALAWSSFERFGGQGLRFLVTIILARLLTPIDFGLIGMVMVFVVIAESLVNFGFAQAIIHKKELSEDDLTTAFYLSLFFAVFLYSLIFLYSGVIAKFFSQPAIALVIKVVGVVIIFDALVVIQRVLFEKSLDFKSLSLIGLITSILSSAFGIALALLNYGVWALVIQSIGQKIFLTIGLWIRSNWYPKGKISFSSFKQLFHYGWKLQISGLLDQSFKNIHALIIGRFFPIEMVGYYNKAKTMKDLPMISLSSIVTKVAFPVFSSIQNDQVRLKAGFKKSLQLLCLVSFPVMLGGLAIADILIPFLLGPQWVAIIILFQLLSLEGMLYPIHSLNVNILKAVGRTDLFLKLEIIKKVITILAVIISIRWGVIGLVISQVITSYIGLVLNTAVAGGLINYKTKEQILDVFPIAIVSVIMAVSVKYVGIVISGYSEVLILPAMIITGIIVYSFLVVLFRIQSIKSIAELFRFQK